MASRNFKRALPWFVGIMVIVLAGYVYLGPHRGAPGVHVTPSQSMAPVLPSAGAKPRTSIAGAPSTSSNGPASPMPQSSTPPTGGQGRPNPFSPLVATQEGRATGTSPLPAAGYPLAPPARFPTAQVTPPPPP